MLQLKLNVSKPQLRTLLVVFIIANVVLLLGTAASNNWGANSNNKIPQFLLAQADLTRENVIASWYSSMLLLLAAVTLFVCFLCDAQFSTNWKGRFLNYGWLLFCAAFLLLSFDEMGSFHEMIGDTGLLKNIGFGEGGGWNAFYLLVGLAGLFMMVFFIVKFWRSKWALVFALAGVLLYLSNPFQEFYEIQSYQTHNSASFKRPTALLLLEEGSELFGSLSFVLAFTLYIIYCQRAVQPSIKERIYVTINTHRKKVFAFAALVLVALGFLMTLFFFNKESVQGGDDGVAVNWFPALVSFLLFAYFLYQFSNAKSGQKQWLLLPLFAAFTCLLASAYFGSNLYQEPLLRRKFFSVASVQSVCIALALLLECLLFFTSRQHLGKFFMLAAAVFSLLFFFIKPFYFPLAGFAVFSAIVFATIANVNFKSKLPGTKTYRKGVV